VVTIPVWGWIVSAVVPIVAAVSAAIVAIIVAWRRTPPS
jgi:hypothetical protein